MEAALPYLHQCQPLAIETKGDARGVLVIGDLTVQTTAKAGEGLPLAPIEENQCVIDVTPAKSDGEKSDTGEKS